MPMSPRLLLITSLWFMGTNYAHANESAPNSSLSFADLCKYDDDCERLRDRSGMIKPKQKIVLLLKELRDPIKSISEKFEVDPRAVAGGILAENTMNVQVDDDIQEWLVKLRITPAARILGKTFSIGLGQINVSTAQSVESLAAKIEKRKVRSANEIAEALLTPEGAFTYAAAIVRTAQDDYKGHGIDISKDPDILVTLYNLGGSKEKAQHAARNRQKPRPNYFGFFVNQNLDLLSDTLQFKPGQLTSPTKAETQEVVPSKPVVLQPVLIKPTVLYTFPPQCSTSGPGEMGDYAKVFSLTKSPSKVSGVGKYDVLSLGLDCSMTPWTLIRTKDGKTGWVEDRLLSANSEQRNLPATNTKLCDPTKNISCREAVTKTTPGAVLGFDEKQLLEIRAVGDKSDPNDVNFKRFHPQICFFKNQTMLRQSQSSQREVKLSVLKAAEAEDLAIQLEKKRDQIVQVMGYASWDSSENVFRNDFRNTISNIRFNCKTFCKGPVDLVKDLLAADFAKYKGLKGFRQFKADTQAPNTNSGGLYFQEEKTLENAATTTNERWKNWISDAQKECGELLTANKEIAEEFAALQTRINGLSQNLSLSPEYTMVSGFPQTCKALLAVWKRRATNKKSEIKTTDNTDSKLEAQSEVNCAECQVNLIVPFGTYGQATASVSLDAMEKLLESPEDFESIILESIKSAKSYFPPVDGDGGGASEFLDCKYDPFATADRIEKLLKHRCVEAVFVPDMFLVKKLEKYEGRIFHKVFLEEDRFAIRLREECEEVSK